MTSLRLPTKMLMHISSQGLEVPFDSSTTFLFVLLTRSPLSLDFAHGRPKLEMETRRNHRISFDSQFYPNLRLTLVARKSWIVDRQVRVRNASHSTPLLWREWTWARCEAGPQFASLPPLVTFGNRQSTFAIQKHDLRQESESLAARHRRRRILDEQSNPCMIHHQEIWDSEE